MVAFLHFPSAPPMLGAGQWEHQKRPTILSPLRGGYLRPPALREEPHYPPGIVAPAIPPPAPYYPRYDHDFSQPQTGLAICHDPFPCV